MGDDVIKHSPFDDLFDNVVEFMNFENYGDWCNPPLDPLSSPLHSMPELPITHQNSDNELGFPVEYVGEDNGSCQQPNHALGMMKCSIPRQSFGQSFAERMLWAFSVFKDSLGGGVLAQIWVPVKNGDRNVLTTCDQPYLLDQMLAGYREVSRAFTFSAEVKPGFFPGLPGRVFTSHVPEWTSNVAYYNGDEYLRIQYAMNHDVRGSIALPVFEGTSCCAVLELVTRREKPDFDSEIENICRALQSVNLRSTSPPQLYPQCLSRNQRAALSEITNVSRTVCQAHKLPLALTWIPCSYTEKFGDETIRVRVKNSNSSPNEKSILCIEATTCYANEPEMQGFVHACKEHYLEQGQGIAGKALQSNHPFFVPDIKQYGINEYPLVHHARKFGLNSAVAIRLRSMYTGDDDYVLEFFLPIEMKVSGEQEVLLTNLSCTMKRICRSLRSVSDEDLIGVGDSKVAFYTEKVLDVPPVSETNLNSTDSNSSGIRTNGPREQTFGGSRRRVEKKRTSSEKSVSLSVLQQYFSGSLKDAAKSIGVCPTTLKRICRQHGISRWPSRKISKVNRSLRKIQTVLNSVQGMEGGLKFDPTTGELVAASSIAGESNSGKNILFPAKTLPVITNQTMVTDASDTTVKLEEESYNLEKTSFNKMENSDPFLIDAGIECDNGVVEHNQSTSSGMTDSSYGSGSSSCQKHCSKNETSFGAGDGSGDVGRTKITVKATYKDNMIRFKFEPSRGCIQLYEEVAKRFKLLMGTFQLKYRDDEEEWVMLVNDSDLMECLEVLDFVGTSSVKFLVRDVTCGMGSSGSSNCFLT